MPRLKITQKNFPLFITALLISSCAQITAPTGGDRDKTPPNVITESPPNNSINFSSKIITIRFNEFVQVLSAQNIVISPETEPQPEIMAKKKELNIKFKKPLEANTTYSIFLGSNIGDINENNRLENYSYVFSTGSFLDSLTVHANIQAAQGEVPENTFLLLYKEKDDSAFQKKRPFYLSKVEKDGSALLEHVKDGIYKAYALTDKNLNYYYDLPTEMIGFADSAITISGNYDSLRLPLFLPEETKFRIVEYDKYIKGGMWNFTLNKELSFTKDEITVRVAEDSTLQTSAFQDKDNKHLKVYFTNLPKDSANYTLIIKNNGQLLDSVRAHCESKHFKTTAIYFTDTTALKNLAVLESQPLKLSSSYYSLSVIDTTKIELVDSSKNNISFTITRDADLKTYLISATWKDKMKYHLTFHDSAISDLAGNFNQQQLIFFTGITKKKAGTLQVTVELPDPSHNSVILLKDNAGKIINTTIARDSPSLHLNYGLLLAGGYSLEVVDDANNNGIWNSGNFSEKTLPEKIFKFEKPILIKEIWDAEEKIQVDYRSKIIAPTELAPKKSSGSIPDFQQNKNQGKVMKEE